MLCDECGKNEATVHSIRKINGVTTERHLCAECNKKYGYQMMKLSNIGDLFSNFSSMFGTRSDTMICPKCGTTSEDFLETGYVGCPHCYTEFSSIILPAVRKMQNDVRHVGKVPGGVKPRLTEIDKLKSDLQKAVEREDYEQAIVLTDKLKELEKKQAGGVK